MTIRCHKLFLHERCRERGYTIEEVMPCVVSRDGDLWEVDPDHPAYPMKPRKGLGDYVESALQTIGITEERFSRLVGKPCGCKKRKRLLNKLGQKLGFGRGIGADQANK
jgi:hypothetical protein